MMPIIANMKAITSGALAIAIALLSAGCGLDEDESRPTYDGLIARIEAAETAWGEKALKDYDYTLFSGTEWVAATYTVTVRGGERQSAVQTESGQVPLETPVTVTPGSPDDDRILTIEATFTEVLRWARSRPEELDVVIDPDHGVITSAHMDPDEGIADDGRYFEIRSFVPGT